MIFPNIYGVIYVVKSKVAFQIKTVGTKLQILQFLTVVSVRSVDEIKPVSHFWLWAVSTLLAPPPLPPLPFLSGWRQPPSELTSLRRGGGWRSAAIKKRCEDAKHPEASNLQRGASLSCQVSIWVRSGKNSFQFGNCSRLTGKWNFPLWEVGVSENELEARAVAASISGAISENIRKTSHSAGCQSTRYKTQRARFASFWGGQAKLTFGLLKV